MALNYIFPLRFLGVWIWELVVQFLAELNAMPFGCNLLAVQADMLRDS